VVALQALEKEVGMSFDAVRMFIASKDAYARTRGARSGTGLYPETKTIPKTNYGDVTVFAAVFSNAVSVDGCLKRLAAKYAKEAERRGKCGTIPVLGYDPCVPSEWIRYWGSGSNTGCAFPKTTSYKNAFDAWIKTWPMVKDPSGFALKVNQEYPHNEEFWTTGLRYAIARSAAGVVPGNFELAIEAVNEAVSELPGNVAAVVRAANPMNHIPNLGLGSIGELIKWGSIGGGLFILYKYVLKPKQKNR
jgi:hypothetical protein